MKFCLRKIDMTPDQPVFLSGYGDRNRKSDGIADPIYCKVVLLQANKALLILTFDATGGDRSFVNGLKLALKERFGLQEDAVLLNFSHSHCSINLTGEDPGQRRGNYSMAQDRYPEHPEEVDYTEDVRYYNWLKDLILQAVHYCFSHLQEGNLMLGTGTTDVAVSRRLLTDSGVQFKPNPHAHIDKDLNVFKLVDCDGNIKGIIFSCACHPSSLSGYLLSADFVGHACSCLETRYPEAVAVFLQGCAAELKPAKGVSGDSFKSCSIPEMQEIGAALADEVNGMLESGQFATINGPFTSVLSDVRLLTDPLSVSEIEQMLEDETKTEYRKKAVRRLLKAIAEDKDRKILNEYISVWRLDEETKIVAMEGEIFSEFSLSVKALFPPGKTIVLGYSNGVSTYIPTRKVLQEGGYEAEVYIFFLRGPFFPEVEEIMLGSIVKMTS